MKKLFSMICCVLALTLCLTACGQSAASNEDGLSLAKGGVLILSVNPEIEIEYDENGTVTGVTARNDDALAIINSCTGLIGQPTREVVTELVTAIGEAGYFVEEIEGEHRQITLEIEPGSSLPNDAFLADVIAVIRDAVNQHDWSTPLVEGESDFGITDYIDTDYGEGNNGYTDYDDTDYGPNNDGVTDDSDYGTTDGQSDYNESNTNYHEYFDYLIKSYFESGYFETVVEDTASMVAPYVEQDPTAFCAFDDWFLGVETIKDFCLLRAESVRGQLDGTIPSTIAAQAKDNSAFADASNLWLPDLGEIADLKDGYQ